MTRHTPKGYTLVELLVSLAIFAIVMVAATAAYLAFLDYNRRAQATTTIMNSLSFAIDLMARDIRTGSRYCLASSGYTCTTSQFQFTNADGCAVTYASSGGAIIRSQSGAGCPPESNAALTPPAISIQNLSFYTRGTPSGDNLQPLVTIVVNGQIAIPNSTQIIPFQIETSATERLPDL